MVNKQKFNVKKLLIFSLILVLIFILFYSIFNFSFQSRNIKVDGEFDSLILKEFIGKVDVSGDEITFTEGIIKNIYPLKVKLHDSNKFSKEFKKDIDENGFLTVEAKNFKIDIDENNLAKSFLFSEGVNLRFYGNDKSKVYANKIKIQKETSIKNEEVIPDYKFKISGKNINFEAKPVIDDSGELWLNAPRDLQVKIKHKNEIKDFKVSDIEFKISMKGQIINNTVRGIFDGSCGELKLGNNITDEFNYELESKVNEVISIKNGLVNSFRLKNRSNEELTVVENDSVEKYQKALSIEGAGKRINVKTICNEDKSHIILNGKVSTWDFKVKKSFIKKVKKYLIPIIITIISGIILWFLENKFLEKFI